MFFSLGMKVGTRDLMFLTLRDVEIRHGNHLNWFDQDIMEQKSQNIRESNYCGTLVTQISRNVGGHPDGL